MGVELGRFTIPISSPTMRTNNVALILVLVLAIETVRLRCELRIGEVDTPVSGEGTVI